MPVPPRSNAPDEAGWEVAGERPTRPAPAPKPDRAGLLMVALLLVALLVAVVLMLLL